MLHSLIVAASLTISAHGQTLLDQHPELKLTKKSDYEKGVNSFFTLWEKFTGEQLRELDSQQSVAVYFPEDQFAKCAYGSWHCCWQNKYDNKKAGDNSKILQDANNNAYPDAKTHCHGSAWSVMDDSDPNWRFRKEIFNHVVSEDHGYKRGYWGGIKDNNGIAHLSCGCSENMPLVTRSDCTEANEKKAKDGKFKPKACTGKKRNDLRSWYEKLHGSTNGMANPAGKETKKSKKKTRKENQKSAAAKNMKKKSATEMKKEKTATMSDGATMDSNYKSSDATMNTGASTEHGAGPSSYDTADVAAETMPKQYGAGLLDENTSPAIVEAKYKCKPKAVNSVTVADAPSIATSPAVEQEAAPSVATPVYDEPAGQTSGSAGKLASVVFTILALTLVL
ncbi:MAG: hypothetical protein SGCHY_002191 [Lobulomycetales sp.]